MVTTLAHYLFTRLRQLGVESMHGVPGDYNLVALDYLKDAGLTWIGDANELNAGEVEDYYVVDVSAFDRASDTEMQNMLPMDTLE